VDVETLIEEDHSARAIWQLIGQLDLSLCHAKIAAVEGHAGRDHTAPQLLISLWLMRTVRESAQHVRLLVVVVSSRALRGFADFNRSVIGRCPAFDLMIRRGWKACLYRSWVC
jgi:hypothetical protein